MNRKIIAIEEKRRLRQEPTAPSPANTSDAEKLWLDDDEIGLLDIVISEGIAGSGRERL